MRIPIPCRDPYALETVLPDNPDMADYPGVIDIDIVAVHGLNVDDNLVHHRDTWTQDGVLWVKDILPDVVARRCRVMLFSYNVGRGIEEHDAYIGSHARRLLSSLQEQRKNCPRRPLVFICHDFGGFVVKDAIMTAGESRDPEFKATFDATKVFVFFNTPHCEQIASVCCLAEEALVTPKDAVVRKLAQQCGKFVDRLEPWERFRRLYNDRRVLNLYSTNIHRYLSVVIGKRQTTLGLPDHMEKQYPIYGDHSSICKFTSLEDAGCMMVTQAIAAEIDSAVEPLSMGTFTSRVY